MVIPLYLLCSIIIIFILILDFRETPSGKLVLLGHYAEFHCSVIRGSHFWYINETPVREFSPSITYQIDGDRTSSVLRLLGTKLTNNSYIDCEIEFETISNFSRQVPLLVQGIQISNNY